MFQKSRYLLTGEARPLYVGNECASFSGDSSISSKSEHLGVWWVTEYGQDSVEDVEYFCLPDLFAW